MVGYTQKSDPETTAKAYGKEIRVSPKHCEEVSRNIRGRKVEDAKVYLRGVIALKTPVKYRRYIKFLSHKSGAGPGRYPVKAASEILRVIEYAQHNAEYKGLDSDNMKIHTVAIHRGRTVQNYMPRAHGRQTRWFDLTSNIEIILEEIEIG
ncbi:MAG TPA: 50S ribosomal protein L22 [Euryarchaeota archaeon]|nr:50S ribosomal protein L22 [Euryarchaeota archaeon]